MKKNTKRLAALAFSLCIGSNAYAQSHHHKAHHHRGHVSRVAYHQHDALHGAQPRLASSAVMIVDEKDGEAIYSKNNEEVRPIASITKLMTAMVVLDAKLPMDEKLTIDQDNVDNLRHSSSRLPVGTTLTRGEMLRLALMSSENRAASALGHNYPGGIKAFVEAMNEKAKKLGMTHSHFVDSSGLNSGNVSTAADLVKMVEGAYGYETIRHFTTTSEHKVELPRHRGQVLLTYHNTNTLVKNKSPNWRIGLSKTGYINEAGHCLVMQSTIADKPVVIVLLDSWGSQSRIGDANRIKKWLESRESSKQRFG